MKRVNKMSKMEKIIRNILGGLVLSGLVLLFFYVLGLFVHFLEMHTMAMIIFFIATLITVFYFVVKESE